MKCEFSTNHYREILELMKGKVGRIGDDKQIILTHDVDLFPPNALRIAHLEKIANIRSTYYVLLHSELYNALSPANLEIFSKIQDMGHEIALHYDSRFDGDHLMAVHNTFKRWFNTRSVEVSHHLVDIAPNVVVPDYLDDRRRLNDLGYKYIGDSGGWFRNGCFCQHLDEKLFIVCHPEWWVGGTNPLADIYHDIKQLTKEDIIKWSSRINKHRAQRYAK